MVQTPFARSRLLDAGSGGFPSPTISSTRSAGCAREPAGPRPAARPGADRRRAHPGVHRAEPLRQGDDPTRCQGTGAVLVLRTVASTTPRKDKEHRAESGSCWRKYLSRLATDSADWCTGWHGNPWLAKCAADCAVRQYYCTLSTGCAVSGERNQGSLAAFRAMRPRKTMGQDPAAGPDRGPAPLLTSHWNGSNPCVMLVSVSAVTESSKQADFISPALQDQRGSSFFVRPNRCPARSEGGDYEQRSRSRLGPTSDVSRSCLACVDQRECPGVRRLHFP
jgi:hypothetical protein